MRPIVFVTFNSDPTAIVRGHQIVEGLKQRNGYDVRCMGFREFLDSDVCNSVVVVVKRDDRTVIDFAKERGCTVALDILDNRKVWRCGVGAGIDGAIYPNRKLLDDHVLSGKRISFSPIVIHHHWDVRFERHTEQDFKLAYIGAVENRHLIYDAIKDLNTIEKKDFKTIFEAAKSFSCHISIRDQDSEDAKYKPASKLVTAAGCGVNIILTRDAANLEVLASGYPYYTKPDQDSVLETVNQARQDFGSDRWRKGLLMIEEVRSRTRLESMIIDYEVLFQHMGVME